jgi:hypothetical protein
MTSSGRCQYHGNPSNYPTHKRGSSTVPELEPVPATVGGRRKKSSRKHSKKHTYKRKTYKRKH